MWEGEGGKRTENGTLDAAPLGRSGLLAVLLQCHCVSHSSPLRPTWTNPIWPNYHPLLPLLPVDENELANDKLICQIALYLVHDRLTEDVLLLLLLQIGSNIAQVDRAYRSFRARLATQDGSPSALDDFENLERR